MVKSYNTKKLIFNESEKNIFTRSTKDIICESIEQYNYFSFLNNIRSKYIDKLDKLTKKIVNLDNLEIEVFSHM